MRKFLNTLFVLAEDAWLSLDGENIVVQKGDGIENRYPLHTLENVLCFSRRGASPALMGACAQRGVALAFITPSGRFLCRVVGETRGNVLLRREQFRRADSPEPSAETARYFLIGKVWNARQVVERATRDHPMRVDVSALKAASDVMAGTLAQMEACADADGLRGLEGAAAKAYFGVFDQLILQNKTAFRFSERSRRPPLDRINALLSFAYTLLAHDCASALESAGLDPYVGFLHTDRPGRASLALDLMEELRPVVADRFCLSLVNTRVIAPDMFTVRENGAVLLDERGRRALLGAWQERKREQMTHPFLGEKLAWGLVPYVQALLLARFLRGDIDAYPPLLWK